MRLFAIADLHLSLSTDKPMDIFGARWENHHEKLAKNWCGLVKKEDVVLIPGDVSWAMNLREAEADLRFLHELPGEKILLRGNHDFWWQGIGKLERFCKEKGFTSLRFLQNNAFLLKEQLVIAGSRLWLFPDDSRFTKADEKILLREKARLQLSLAQAEKYQGRYPILAMTHYPPFRKNFDANPITELFQEAGVRQVVFGHIHNSDSPYCIREKIIEGIPYSLVAADYLDFLPQQLEYS